MTRIVKHGDGDTVAKLHSMVICTGTPGHDAYYRLAQLARENGDEHRTTIRAHHGLTSGDLDRIAVCN